ncbi:monovalent cation/H(+) antiporter subunit G [Shouchella shacheensis]|uniref:monovalent cation/H(+) antiporter subunit G n=1 Tax=Shouchella shacheensis TaxID=1649580 RepID=UPI00073FDCD8|nr:monovalent cation/H(+) antiporter subunit G [Shouchella shacheensis]
MTAIEWIVSIFVIVGGFFSLLAGIGLIRLPDVYARLHATGKNSTFGVVTIMLGTFLYFLIENEMFIGKLLLTILFVFITAPVAALMISRSAYRTGVPLHPTSVRDEMKPFYEEERKRTGGQNSE